MESIHLPNDRFTSELTLMLHNASTSGEVTITMKRYDGRTVPYPKERTKKVNGKKQVIPAREDISDPQCKCLIRAKSKEKKISTAVDSGDAMKFQLQFIQLMRSSMDGLKKEKKSKRKVKKVLQ